MPDTVRNLTIEAVYPDAILNWDPVTTSIYGSAITVDYYLIFFESDPYDEFEFLAYTAGTTHTHSGVVQFAEAQFYFVEAFIGEIEALDEALASGESLSRGEVYNILKNNNK